MKVNGRDIELDQDQILFDFLNAQGFDNRKIAIEHNGKIIPKTEYETVFLSQEDTIEVVRFVGGG